MTPLCDSYWWGGLWAGVFYGGVAVALLVVGGAYAFLAVDGWRWRREVQAMEAQRLQATLFREDNRDS